jgi:hypothetical protein
MSRISSRKIIRCGPFRWNLMLCLLACFLGSLSVAWAAPRASSFPLATLDADGNGREDILDHWLAGEATWTDLRQGSRHSRHETINPVTDGTTTSPELQAMPEGAWSTGLVRVLALGASPGTVESAALEAGQAGQARVLHDLDHFGGVQVVACDERALGVFLSREFHGKLLLDRDGLPSLTQSCLQIGATQLETGHWQLGNDWSATVAILDSGCDTAHGDLGDFAQDNQDGPAPAVGDADDWYSATSGWPLFDGYKVVGWHDVSDDFPLAQGPWDYHYHGTALASVVAGSGSVDASFAGVNPGGRLTVVKYYDFDGVWHAWAGDFLAACAWTLDNREAYRIRTALMAVNWEADLGISQAMAAFVDAGILPVAAMGNFGDDPAGPGYPAQLADVLTAGSVDPDGAVSVFSGRGLNGQAKPDLLAPGGHVVTADNEPDDTYSMRQGTSLSAAHLAGAAYLLEEALVDNGVALPRDRSGVQTRMALLRGATARVTEEAQPGGQRTQLSAHDAPDQVRGWGLLRVDAAVGALFRVLQPGKDQSDTLSLADIRPTVTRRLLTNPGIRYLVEVVPEPGLDVALDVIDPRLMEEDPFGSLISRANSNGPGVSEFLYHHASEDAWAFLVVRQVSGSGRVTLRLREADSFLEASASVQLPGNLTGAPNTGRLGGSAGPNIVVASRVEVDNVARSVNVLDQTGVALPGWPVYVFPNPSAQGGLTQPVVWDLDGSFGDEIVLGSRFGSVYFFNRLGGWFREELGFNMPLTTAVGVEEISGQRRVLVVDQAGTLHGWSWGPVKQLEVSLGFPLPLDPAVGQLLPGSAEELVIAFEGGTLLATDSQGNTLSGWPVDLGVPLTKPPVLCDLDRDGLHEVIVSSLDPATGRVVFHVRRGNGEPGPGDQMSVDSPIGGPWVQTSAPMVAGFYGGGDLRVSVMGLGGNGVTGVGAGWTLGRASLLADGQAQVVDVPGFEVRATTSQGVLTLQQAILPTPLAFDFLGGSGAEESMVFSIEWSELLYGLTAIDGAASGRFQPTRSARPLESRVSLRQGGASGVSLASAGQVLVSLDTGIDLQVLAANNQLWINPILAGYQASPGWPAARSDHRNSGAYPLAQELTAVPALSPQASRLTAYPNPGPGHFNFRLQGGEPQGAEVRIYDLRGRQVQVLRQGVAKALPGWDGTDSRGRKVAAGTYLAVMKQGPQRLTTRLVVTR